MFKGFLQKIIKNIMANNQKKQKITNKREVILERDN